MPHAFVSAAAGAGAEDVTIANGNVLTFALQDIEAGTPAIVRALVLAGAPILSVRTDDRPLEEVYLALVERRFRRGARVMIVPARILALLRKEIAELARNRSALLPVAFVALITTALPFFIAVATPKLSGHPLSNDADLVHSLTRASGELPGIERLSEEAAVQAFIFSRFLVMTLLVPVTGAITFAGHSLIGEKIGRSLEPLLATPITTTELLLAKVAGAMLPSLAIMMLHHRYLHGWRRMAGRAGRAARLAVAEDRAARVRSRADHVGVGASGRRPRLGARQRSAHRPAVRRAVHPAVDGALHGADVGRVRPDGRASGCSCSRASLPRGCCSCFLA